VIPVYRVEVGDEFVGATVIEPNKGCVDVMWLHLVMMAVHCDGDEVVVNID